jgi:DNA (cytosine-5)-methyltransferase 1
MAEASAQSGGTVRSVGSLFTGIGGIDLGLERAGMSICWQVEIDDSKRAVLARHWPTTPRFGDIAEVTAEDVHPVDVLCGGFPCQDLSHAGRRAGIEGQRSGLWAHFSRLVGELQPRYVLVENTAGLLVRGMGRVVGDLAALGYDAEWDCLPAAAFGAPHLRARIWILAYPCGIRDEADDTVFAGRPITQLCAGWSAEPDVGRVADGISGGMDVVCWLGDAVVPQVAEWIGRRLMATQLGRTAPNKRNQMMDTMTAQITPDECFAKAFQVLDAVDGDSDAKSVDALIAREWRQLGEAIANAKR